MKNHRKDEYAVFLRKIMLRFSLTAFISVCMVLALYLFMRRQRFGDWTVGLLEYVLRITHEEAFYLYHFYFRGFREVFLGVTILLVFVLLLGYLFRWMTGYFKEIDQGIDALLAEDRRQICLSVEMLPFERKLNAVKRELEKEKAEAAEEKRRKDELVMYLAHDIRTPLTSVIGYLNLLEENPDMPVAQRAKHVHITLEKANRLEAMINEFFEITRMNSGQMQLAKERIDLYYMLVQLCDEMSPVLESQGNRVVLDLKEDLAVFADADKMARVFGNLLKNAAAYSYPNSEITITALEKDGYVVISFRNRGRTIPAEKLPLLFDKFYRADAARESGTGGTGLGLAIAKEIILLHGGTIRAASEEETVTFLLSLPLLKFS